MKSKIKVLILDLGKEYGGAEKMLENLVQSSTDILDVSFYINEINYKKFKDKEVKKTLLSRRTNKKEYIKLIKEIYLKIKKEDIKVVNTHGMAGNMIGLILNFFLKFKFIITIHSDINYDFKGVKRILYYFLEKIMVNLGDEVIVVSQNLANKIYKNHKVKCKIIHNGVRKSNYDEFDKIKNKKLNLLYVGRLSEVKNIPFLLNGLKFLKDKNIDFICNIVGEGPEESKLISMVEQLELKNLVQFQGFSEDIGSFMRSSDVLVMTSNMEGIPMVIIEAFLNKLIVLSSEVGGISEMIEHGYNGFLFEKENERQFQDLLMYLSTIKEAELLEISSNAYKSYQQKWDVGKMKKLYLKIFDE